MRLGFNGATTMTSDLETDIRIAGQAGFDALEITASKLQSFLNNHSIDDAHKLIEEAGLMPSTINSIERINFRNAAGRAEVMAQAKQLSQYACGLACPRKAIPAWPYHRSAQLVEPGPSCLIAAQSEHPLQTQGANAVLLAGDEPHSQEPHPQRLACVLEHCAGRQRRAPTTTPAPQQPIRHRPRFADHSAVRAGKPIRPVKPPDIVPAPRLAAEPIIHLLERPRVINSRNRVLRIFRPSTLPFPRRPVKGIPNQEIMVSESAIYWGVVPRGTKSVKEVFITILARSTVRILGAESTDPRVKVQLQPVEASDAQKFKLLLVHQPMSGEGYHFVRLVIRTSSPVNPEVRIPLRGIIT